MYLFSKDIQPACEYCEHGKLTSDKQIVLCTKKGSKQPYDCCKSFLYAPLKRTPTRLAPLPKFDKKDFSL
ncbi:MAG: hypothetical protein RSE07_00550 [Oscillospiraceae bacterium]